MKSSHILPLITISLLTIFALANLEAFPIFADEAIYLFWAQKIRQGIAHPLISMYDGKPPLFIWLAGLASLFSHSLLLAGRTISVFAYTATLILIYFGLEKHKRRWAWLALFLTASSPFILFHSRLAILDMLFCFFITASIFIWSDTKIKYRGLLTGILLGLAFWVKTPALFLLPFPLISSLLSKQSRLNIKQAIISFITALFLIASLRISVWFPFLFNRTGDFSYSINEILKGQTGHIVPNALSLLSWLVSYRLWPIILAALFGIIIGIRKRSALIINLIIASVCFTLPFIAVGKVLAPRYYLFLGIALPILAAFSISQLAKRLSIVLTTVIIITFIPFNIALIRHPLNISLPQVDKGQYLQNWASGIGIKEASDFFVKQAKNGSVKVLSEGYFGTLPDGLFVEIGSQMNGLPLEIVGVGENSSPTYYRELAKSETDNIYYIGNHDRISLINRPEFELVLSYPKVDGGPALEVYRIKR